MFALNSQDQGTILLSQQDYIPLIVDSFLIDRKAQSVSPETLSFYQKKLKYLLSFCEAQAVTQVSQLTPELIRRFILQLAGTLNRGGAHACFRPLRTLVLSVERKKPWQPAGRPVHRVVQRLGDVIILHALAD
jgi:hypothetical protein